MSGINQIFLDLDGPLLDGKERHYFCYKNILLRHGFQPISINEYWESKRAGISRDVLLRRSGAESFYEEYFRAWLAAIESPESLSLDKIQIGVMDSLTQWKSSGIHITLVTMRMNRKGLMDQLAALNIYPLLDEVVVCEHGNDKADAVIKSGFGSNIDKSALWIGDTEADYKAANTLGCDIILVENGLRSKTYLSCLSGAQIVSSIGDIELS